MTSLLTPAILVLSRFKYVGKFLLIGALFAALVAMLLAEIVTAQYAASATTRRELEGTTLLPKLVTLMDSVQKHRAAATFVAMGNTAKAGELPEKRAQVDQALADIESFATGNGDTLEMLSRLADLRNLWAAAQAPATTPDLVFERHTAVVDAIREAFEHVGKTSALILDPTVSGYYLSDIAINLAPALAERHAHIRSFGTRGLADATLSPEEWERIVPLLAAARELPGRIHREIENVVQDDPEMAAKVKPEVQALVAAEKEVRTTLESIRTGNPMSAEAFFKIASQPVDHAYALIEAEIASLREALHKRQSAERLGMLARLGIVATAGALILYLALGFFVTTRQSVFALVDTAEAFSSGDFTRRARIAGNDEMAQIGRGFDRMAETIGALMSQLQVSVSALGGVCTRLGQASATLASSAEQQSAAAQDTASSAEQLFTSAASVADSVEETMSASEQARELSANGEDVARKSADEIARLANVAQSSAESVTRLSEQSERVDGIVRVIRDVADQTNLLALNAAIEAARAGELGRGFAVVADEVRKLAERTSVATTEIASVIDSMEQGTREAVGNIRSIGANVTQGVEHAQRAATVLSEINAGTGATLRRVSQIHDATREQLAASQNIAQSIDSIARMVEQNTQAMAEIDTSIRDVQQQVGRVETITRRFRIA